MRFRVKGSSRADVAELVDALDLGSSGQKPWGFKSLRPHQSALDGQISLLNEKGKAMTQIQVLKQEGLKHEFSVTVPQGTIQEKKRLKLVEISKTKQMPGFRPGKVPLTVIEQRYGTAAHGEIVDEMISESVSQALTDHKLQPALQPKIELLSIAEDKDVAFTLTVETLPTIPALDFGALAIERPVAEIPSADVDDAIIRVAKRLLDAEPVTEDRPAVLGDVVVIDFDGSVEGEKRPGMKGENHKLELGSKSFVDTFEEQLVGSKVGDKKRITVTFPTDYQAKDLAGKQADFDIEIKELRQPKPMTMDDAMAKELGLPSMEKLRERIAGDLSANLTSMSRGIATRLLLDKLAETYKFEVPEGMVTAEFTSIWGQIEQAKAQNDLPEEDKAKTDEELRSDYRGIAERRIRLGFLLSEVARTNAIEVPGPELHRALMNEARQYPGQEKKVIEYYTKQKGALDRLRAPLLEEKVIDHILSQAVVTDKLVSQAELEKLADAE